MHQQDRPPLAQIMACSMLPEWRHAIIWTKVGLSHVQLCATGNTRLETYLIICCTKKKCVQLHATQLTVFIQRWRLLNFCKMSLLHLRRSLYTSTAQIKKKTRSTPIKTDTWDIYVTLLIELSAFGKSLNNKSWTVHPNIAFRREGHRKIQFRDLHLLQMMSQCCTTSRKSRRRSLHAAIPNVAGNTSRATCRLLRLTEHMQRNMCSE